MSPPREARGERVARLVDGDPTSLGGVVPDLLGETDPVANLAARCHGSSSHDARSAPP